MPKSKKRAKAGPEPRPARPGNAPAPRSEKKPAPRSPVSASAVSADPKAKAPAAATTLDGKAGRWPKGGPSKADLRRYRQMLLELRRSLLASSKGLAAEALKASGQDFSVDHMADFGSDNYEQDFSLQLLEGESNQLANIREALLRIDGKLDPPFGLCEACADEPKKLCETCPWIPPSRLDVIPHARLCVQTKDLEERGKLP